jgi:signal transduction histidine kinase/ligand-binding sensor domain-containing protein
VQFSTLRQFVRFFLLASTLVAFSSLASAAAPSAGHLISSSGKWQVESGWHDESVNSILQTRDGYLWLGSYTGLLRFDGARFVSFLSANTPGLLSSRVTCLFEDDTGWLWIGHESGEVSRSRNGVFEPVLLPPGWPGGAVEAIASDSQGLVWLLNDAGMLMRLSDGRLAPVPGGASPTRKVLLERSSAGEIYTMSGGKVFVLEQGALVPYSFGDATPAHVARILPARDGGLWTVANDEIMRWDGRGFGRPLCHIPGISSAVTDMIETRTGALLLGTLRDGCYIASSNSPVHFSRATGLSHDWVRALAEDHEGNFWVGTGGGLDSLRIQRISMLPNPDNWQGCAVMSFGFVSTNEVWVGTEGAGLYHRVGDSWTRYTEAQGLSNVFVWSVLVTRNQEVLVGSWGGGLRYWQGEKFAPRGDMQEITPAVTALLEDRDGAIWAGSPNGIYCFRNDTRVFFVGKEQLAYPDVRSLVQAPDGTIWFGMFGGGLARYREGVLRQFRKADGLPSDSVSALLADADGTLWLGTPENGLVRYRDGKFTVVTKEHGIPEGTISHLADDARGFLWIGSNRGIYRVARASLNRCADGAAPYVRVLAFGRSDGLLSQTTSGGFSPGARLAPDGRLWFPTLKGMAVIDPAGLRPTPNPPRVVVEEIRADGELIPAGAGHPQIPPGRQPIEIRYTALSFTSPDQVRFRYRLEGLQSGWNEAGSKRTVQYAMLPPGHYAFRVTACNNDDIWSAEEAGIEFEVLPQFWQTWWFRLLAIVAAAGLLTAGISLVLRRRVRRRLEQLEKQRALERERARIARDIHDDLGASLTRITMLSQTVRGEVEGQPQAMQEVDQIYQTARDLTRAMDEIVWAVNPRHDTLESLVNYLGRFAQSFTSTAGIRCRLDVPISLPEWSLTAEIRHNVFLVLKEALNNVVRHASATEVRVTLEIQPDGFTLTIADNGRGFQLAPASSPPADSARVLPGNGLANMRKRLDDIGGQCEWLTAPGEGTRVRITVPIRL